MRTGEWVGDCFIYTNSTNRFNYLVGDQTYTISHFDGAAYVLGYLPRDGRIYVCDKDVQLTSFALSLAVVEYQTLVLRGDLDAANATLPSISPDQKNKIARFLEGQGYREQALEVATDAEHRFELALGLGRLGVALELARAADAEHKWKTVGDAALGAWDIALAEECYRRAADLGSLLLLHSSTGDGAGLRALAHAADAAGANNIAFSALWQLADVEGCVACLLKTGRTAEAALFAQTYAPSRLPAVAARLRRELEDGGRAKVARILGMPPGVEAEREGLRADDDLFPEWDEWLRLEAEGRGAKGTLVDVDGDAGDDAKANGVNGSKPAPAPEAVEADRGLESMEHEVEAEAEEKEREKA